MSILVLDHAEPITNQKVFKACTMVNRAFRINLIDETLRDELLAYLRKFNDPPLDIPA